MFVASDLPETIPLFPIPGAVLLPRARLPLHLFEPRYLQMFEDALKTSHRLIGVIQPHAPPPDDTALHDVGCAGRIIQFSETSDGRYMITLGGVSRFRIATEEKGFTPYRRASVSWDEFTRDLSAAEVDRAFDRDGFMKLLERYFKAHKLDTDWENLMDAEAELLINSLSMLCPFDTEEKQALLEAPSLCSRRETLVTLMEFSLRRGPSEETLQ